MMEWVPTGTSLAAERPASVIKTGMQLSGTSFAAPVVSGIAADLLGIHPEWTPDQVKGALMRAATVVTKVAPLSAGVGEVNIQKALGDSTTPPNPNARQRLPEQRVLEQCLLAERFLEQRVVVEGAGDRQCAGRDRRHRLML
jgi:hypothetical protein